MLAFNTESRISVEDILEYCKIVSEQGVKSLAISQHYNNQLTDIQTKILFK